MIYLLTSLLQFKLLVNYYYYVSLELKFYKLCSSRKGSMKPFLNPLPRNKFPDWLKLKAFADNTINFQTESFDWGGGGGV